MDEKTCKNLYQGYLRLKSKIRSGTQAGKRGQPYKTLIDGRDAKELSRLKNGLECCLEFLSNDELFEIYTDKVLGAKAKTVLRKRRGE